MENLKAAQAELQSNMDAQIEKSVEKMKDVVSQQVSESLKEKLEEQRELTAKNAEAIKNGNDAFDKYQMEAKMARSAAEQKTFRGAVGEAVDGNQIKKQLFDGVDGKLQGKAVVTIATDITGDAYRQEITNHYAYEPTRPQRLRDIVPMGATDAHQVTYIEETYTDNAGMVAENAAPADTEIALEEKTEQMKRVKAILKISEEMLDDTAALTSFLSMRLPNHLLQVEDAQILDGSGTGNNIQGISTTATQDFSAAANSDLSGSIEAANQYDVILAAILQLETSHYKPNAIILHPSDFYKIMLLKSTQNEYLLKQIQVGMQPTIMGLPVYKTTAQTAGTFLVGDTTFGTQVWMRQGLSLEFSRDDSDNFQKNVVTVRATERLAQTVYQPKAFSTDTFTTAQALLETA